MDISFKGANCVVISNKKTTLIVDPKISLNGLKDPNIIDYVELATDARYELEGARLQIEGPGEYEVGDFSISGIAAHRHTDSADKPAQATMYRIANSEFRIAVIGHVSPKLTDIQLETLGLIDILIIPVGGNGFTLDPHDAAAITRQIDPKVVIPTHYEDTGVTYEVPQLALSEFVKELAAPVLNQDRIKYKNSLGLPEVLTIIQLQN